MSRKTAREDAFKLIFSAQFQDKPWQDYLKEYDEIVGTGEGFSDQTSGDDRAYMEAVVKGVLTETENLDETIRSNLTGWDFDRLSKVSIAILRLAIYEMNFMDDIPLSVSINEAVNLAKKYDAEEVRTFVNGVLGSIAKGRE